MDLADTSSLAAKKTSFSCEACRSRKVKCGGEHPSCMRCLARGQECHYKLQPTLSYTKKLELRVEQLERTNRSMQAAAGGVSSSSYGAASSASVSASASASVQGIVSASPVSSIQIDPADPISTLATSFNGLDMDPNGRVSFHGPTSFTQWPHSTSSAEDVASTRLATDSKDGDRERLVNRAWTERAHEKVYHFPENVGDLLSFYWIWIQPLFGWIYRPAFFRDMKNGGPNYSDFLLNAILVHVSRWCKHDPKWRKVVGANEEESFMKKSATAALTAALQDDQATIPTVQALLLLSSRLCATANLTQAWLFSGIAFRLVEDLGILIGAQRYHGQVVFSTEDIEIRTRLFWACYNWDKLISLYMGRAPTLQASGTSPPREILDDSEEFDIWELHHFINTTRVPYPPTQARATSCFVHFCGLTQILNVVLVTLYKSGSPGTDTAINACNTEQDAALGEWFAALPDHLRIDVQDMPSQCPPNHIVTLNLAFHMVKILLHRPMLALHGKKVGGSLASQQMNHLQECVRSSLAIVALFEMLADTFGYKHIGLLQSYTVYTAASIFLLQTRAMRDLRPNAERGLRFCVSTLERVKTTTPIISSALSQIYRELRRQEVDLFDVAGATSDAHVAPTDNLGLQEAYNPFTVEGESVAVESIFMDLDDLNGDLDDDFFTLLSQTEPLSTNVVQGEYY